MLTTGDHGAPEGGRKAIETIQDRLALTRLLLWAEMEAESLGADAAAGRIREAISALHTN